MVKKAVLSARNIAKHFNEPVRFKVLDDVSFDVAEGEFVTIVGKSGSGKSTLLYCLSTMDTDFNGDVVIKGNSTKGLKTDELAVMRGSSIGFVFQFHYLMPEFSCLHNVMIPALRLGKFSDEEVEYRAYEKLGTLGLRDQALKDASKLSGGQQQRVAIARALINDPAIIMGDEPTGNLDSQNTNIVRDVFRQLSADFGQTIIAVTHDTDFAAESDRTIEMADGRVIDVRRNVM